MGSPPARDAVLTAYAQSLIKYKARQLSRKPGFSRSDEDDLAQELTARLLSKAHLFDPSRGSVNTFADRVLHSATAMILRERRRQKRAAGFAAQSLDGPRTGSDEGVGSLRDMLTDADLRRRIGVVADEQHRTELLAAVRQAIRLLPAEEQEICRRLLETPAARVARELGISRRQLGNVIQRIRTQFESEGLGDF